MMRRALLGSILFSLSAAGLGVFGGCGDDSATGGGGAGAGGDAPTGSCAEAHPTCTVLHQKGDGTAMYSLNAVGFEVEEELGAAALPDVFVVSPKTNGPVMAGSVKLSGMKGLVVTFLSTDAVTDLLDYDGRIPGTLYVGTSGRVIIDEGIDYGSQYQGRVTGSVESVFLEELDDKNQVLPGGRCLCLESGTFDSGGRDIACEAPASAPTGACFADWQTVGHDCDPFTNDGCMAGELCDFNGGYFTCYPVEGTEGEVCAACDNINGPHCLLGSTCDSNNDVGKCSRFCCTDADCGTGGACVALGIGGVTNIGVCLTQ